MFQVNRDARISFAVRQEITDTPSRAVLDSSRTNSPKLPADSDGDSTLMRQHDESLSRVSCGPIEMSVGGHLPRGLFAEASAQLPYHKINGENPSAYFS